MLRPLNQPKIKQFKGFKWDQRRHNDECNLKSEMKEVVVHVQ
jgi:hypothetical protein